MEAQTFAHRITNSETNNQHPWACTQDEYYSGTGILGRPSGDSLRAAIATQGRISAGTIVAAFFVLALACLILAFLYANSARAALSSWRRDR